jgi:CBS domain-containing protein
MKVRSVFQPEALSARIDESLLRAIQEMDFQGVSALPVIEHETLVGIITERDVIRAIAEGVEVSSAPVGEHMTRGPTSVELETSVPQAASMMLDLGTRHLPVVEGGRVIGMVSSRDLLVEQAFEGE